MIRVTRPQPSRIDSFKRLSSVALLSLLGGLTACDGSATMPVDVPTASVPLLLERFQAADTNVTGLGTWISLSVRVSGLHTRMSMAGVPVHWRATTAAVDFMAAPSSSAPPPIPSSASLTLATDKTGISLVWVRSREIDTATITASLGGSDTSRVTFTLTTTEAPTYVIGFGPVHDCNEASTFIYAGSSAADLIVPLGAAVEWVYASWLHHSCTARITSVSAPAGAAGFASGAMSPGDRFRFVPPSAGTWTYVDAVNGGSATLTVKDPK